MTDARRDHSPAPLAMAELPVPTGWFAVALSRELPAGRAVPARVGSQDLVAWRDERRTARVASAWCPHLGAHLGHLGRVRGETLVCGFHGFVGDQAAPAPAGAGRGRRAHRPLPPVGGAVPARHSRGAGPGRRAQCPIDGE